MKLSFVPLAAAACLAVAGCTSTVTTAADGQAGSATISVASTDSECRLSGTQAPAGPITFDVKNDGGQVTEFYLLAGDGQQIMGEVENIGPGLTRQLVVAAPAGSYVTACKPGMTGDGIRGDFTVTASASGSPAANATTAKLDVATEGYAAFVKAETAELVEGTKEFAQAYTSGDFEQARALYAPVRVHWERIEPVAESFGDLDPKLDLREADLEPGQEWTGWHRIEKDLWPPKQYQAMTEAQRAEVAALLVADTDDLANRVAKLTYRPDQLGNGAKELMDEVATGKVTGEEEAWSHTDLWDFQANVDGARKAYELLRPVLNEKDPDMAKTLQVRFDKLQVLLDKYRSGDGFVLYTDLTPQQVQELSRAVDALGEPLSQLTAAVVQ